VKTKDAPRLFPKGQKVRIINVISARQILVAHAGDCPQKKGM
jgi:hypothetical protein